MSHESLTPFAEVNRLITAIHREAKPILGDEFVGVYLFGSLVLGSFDRHSDIDILFVVENDVSEAVFEQLRLMHERIAQMDAWWGTRLEVSYFSREAVRRYDPQHLSIARIDEGPSPVLHRHNQHAGWNTQRSVLLAKGIVIEGPPLAELIDPVSSDEIRAAMLPMLEAWIPKINAEHIVWRAQQAYIVLSMCRVMYTLQTGMVAPKRVALAFMQELIDKQGLDPAWHGLIDRAWIGREQPELPIEAGDVALTIALARYVLDAARERQ